MNQHEARAEILKKAQVTRQLVTLAKAFLLSPDRPEEFRAAEMIPQFARHQGYERIDQVVLHPSINPASQIENAAGQLTCTVAIAQAVWDLIYSGYFMTYASPNKHTYSQQWTTVVPGSGGTSAGWNFEEISYVLPELVIRSPFCRYVRPDPITDPDLFLLEAGMQGADPEVEEALRDAVLCLREGLYRPAVTVLGKAMEGAWIELGLALALALPEGSKERETTEKNMTNSDRGLARKIADVRTLYNRRDLLDQVIKASEVRAEELESAVIWSDVVREARNAIHFGAKPTIANSYDKAVVLFLDGAKSLSMMYRIKMAAEP